MLTIATLLFLPLFQYGGEAPLSSVETDRRSEPTRLVLKTLDWDTRLGQPAVERRLSYSLSQAKRAGYWYIQGTPDTMGELKEMVRSFGGQVFDYIPHNAFEVRLPADAVADLKQYAQALLPVHPAWKIDPEVGMRGTENESGHLEISVEFWSDQDILLIEEQLQEAGIEIVGFSVSGRYQRADVLADRADIFRLAHMAGVKWMEENVTAELRNNKSQWVIQTNQSNNTKLWSAGLTGAGVYIGHIDGRIDESSCYFDDPTGASPGPNHRKIKWMQSTGSGESHGTHTAGSAAGDDGPNGGNGDYNGMAPGAFLVHHSSFPGSSQMLTYLNRAHTNGGRIHTNSWGDDGTTSYNTWCRDIDAYSHDNEDGVVMFAVTNGTNLKNPENAKSCVAVGATDKSNPNNHGSGGRGPTADGRRKPEVFAPGCSTVSARSNRNCSTTSMCGTSMASPVVAGGAALVKQYFEDGYYPGGSPNASNGFTPSGSLIRAMLANSGVDMTGVSNGSAKYPNRKEGWGRILLDNAIFLSGDSRIMRCIDVPHSQGIQQGQRRQAAANIPAGAQSLRLTIAFADEPGAANASQPVVNNLDLVAIAPDGTFYRGNQHDTANYGEAIPNPTVGDEKNTIEQIIIANPMPGRWVFRVYGVDVPVGPQGFAGVLTF